MDQDRYAALRNPDVRRFLASRFFLTIGQQMLAVII